MTVTIYTDKVPVGTSTFLMSEIHGETPPVGEWRPRRGAMLMDPTFGTYIAAVRWTGTELQVGEIVPIGPSNTSGDYPLRNGKVYISEAFDPNDNSIPGTVRTFAANADGTITTRVYSYPANPTGWSSARLLCAPNADYLILPRIFLSGSQMTAAKYQIGDDGTLTFVADHTRAGYLLDYSLDAGYGVANPANNIIYWPYAYHPTGPAGGRVSRSIDLNDPFNFHVGTPVFADASNGLPRWARASDTNYLSSYDLNQYRYGDTSWLLPGGEGFAVPQEDGLALYAWNGTDVSFVSVSPFTNGPQSGTFGQIQFAGHQLVGRAYSFTPNFAAEFYYPYADPTWSANLNQTQEPNPDQVNGLGQSIHAFAPGVFLFAGIDDAPALEGIVTATYYLLGVGSVTPVISIIAPNLSAELVDTSQSYE